MVDGTNTNVGSFEDIFRFTPEPVPVDETAFQAGQNVSTNVGGNFFQKMFGKQQKKISKKKKEIALAQSQIDRARAAIAFNEKQREVRDLLLNLGYRTTEAAKTKVDLGLKELALFREVPLFAMKEAQTKAAANVAGSTVLDRRRQLFQAGLEAERASIKNQMELLDKQTVLLVHEALSAKASVDVARQMKDLNLAKIALDEKTARLKARLEKMAARSERLTGSLQLAAAAVAFVVSGGNPAIAIAAAQAGRGVGQAISGDIGGSFQSAAQGFSAFGGAEQAGLNKPLLYEPLI